MVDSKLTIPINFKGSQPQVQRLKKQDEDDHWISEEELYTEGSSDEEKLPHSSRKYNPKGRKFDLKENDRSLKVNLTNVNEKSTGSSATDLNNVDVVDQSDISWRPKRGSIKLPGVDMSEVNQPSNI